MARAAEAAGLDFIGVCDHVAVPDNDYAASMRTTWYDPVATLAWLGAQTTSIHLLSVVWIAAYRHPLLTASSFGTLAHLTGDRIILGVGAGHVDQVGTYVGAMTDSSLVSTTNAAAGLDAETEYHAIWFLGNAQA